MTIKKQILINLGEGNFESGFSTKIKLQEIVENRADDLTQIDCQFPQSLLIPNIYQTWQSNYDAIIKFPRVRAGFKKQQITNVSIPTISECNQNIDSLRESLNHWLNPVNRQLEQALQINPEDEINIVLQTEDINSESTQNLLQKLPWHWWNFLAQDNFTDVAISFSNSEQINSIYSEVEPKLTRPKRVKILCILGDSKNIDVEADRRILRKIPGAYCVFLRQPTRSEFFNFMEKERWDILFFSGHSKTDRDSYTGLLYLNPKETLNIQEIREIIQIAINKYQGMKLAIFNSCDGLGLARQLADLDIAQIIIWREPVPDEIAQEFLKSFLEFFTGQRNINTEDLSLYRSVKEARIQVQKYIENPENKQLLPKVSWLPVIHQNLAKKSITWKQLRGISVDINSQKESSHKRESPIPSINRLLKFINLTQYQEKSYSHSITPRESLLNRVENSWIKGVLEKSLHIEETIELGLSKYPNTVAYPSNKQPENSHQQNQNLPEGSRAIDIFGELENKRTMLILGQPGSGKTIALLEIARELINDARQDTNLAIPVVINLSSWAADKESKPLANWLVEELNRIYQFSQKQCHGWVKNQELLLLLDGLDEVRESKRGACIRAINQFLREYEKTEIVVCCRIEDYNKISEKLHFQTAVFYKSLTEAQINRYFDDWGEALSAVKQLKKDDKAIQELVKIPLTLNLIAVAYQDKLIDELLEINSLEERRYHLINTYIQRRFESEKLSNYGSIVLEEKQLKYSEKQSVYWLSWLAQKITQESRNELLIEQIQPDWLPVGIQQLMYRICLRLIFGLITGLVTVLHFGTLVTDNLGIQVSLVIPTVIAGIISCLSSLPLSSFLPKILPRFIALFISGLIFVIIAGAMISPIVAESIEFEPLRTILSPLIIDGVALSIFLSFIDREIGIIDTIVPSREKARKYARLGLIGGLTYVLIRLFFTNRYTNPKDLDHLFKIIFDILIEFLIFTTIPGLIGFLDRGENLEQTIIPNQGIWRSAQNACLFFVIFFPVGILCSLNYAEAGHEIISTGLAIGLLALMAGGRGPVFAGLVLIQHFTLRLILWWQGYAPWNYARFLDYATERIFLRKVGGGYIFIHQILQEHFAKLSD
ncbi:MAG: NACHT domain-containing protein [Microcoleaceae cyanobacterium]